MLLLDNLYSPVTVNKTTMFGVRPPELCFVKNQGLYYKWFLRNTCTRGQDTALAMQTEAIQLSVKETHWVDGCNSVIRVWLKVLPFLIAYANGDNGHLQAKREILALMSELHRLCLGTAVTASERQWWKELMKHFVVDEGDKPLPIIVFSNIKPTHLLNFLLHVVISFGEFSNELELFGDSTDIHNIFHAAKLYDPI